MAGAGNTAEGGSNGTTVTTGNSGGASGNAWDAITIGAGSTLTYDTTHAMHGSLGYKLDQGNNVALHMEWSTTVGTLTDYYLRYYFYFTANPLATIQFFRVLNGATQAGSLRLTTAGKLQGFNAAGTSVGIAFTNAIALNQWVRVEAHIVHSATVGSIEIKLFNDPDSVTATETQSATGLNMETQGTVYRFGSPTGANADLIAFWMDDIGITPNGYLGPALKLFAPTGAITPTGAAFKQTNKFPVGALTPAGVALKQANKTFSNGSPTLATQETLGSAVGVLGASGSQEKYAQAFQVASAATVSSIDLYLSKTGSPSDNTVVELVSALDGTVLASASVASSTLGAGAWTSFAISAALSASTTYYIQVSRDGARNTSNRANVFLTTGDPYASGNEWVRASGSWSEVSGTDLMFRVIAPAGIAPSGRLNKQTNKFPTGAITPSGGLLKQAGKALAGTLVPTSTLQKLVSKTLTGGLTPSGALTAARLILRTFTGAITPSGSLSKLVGKVASGVLTPSGLLNKLVSKLFTGLVTPTGIARKQTNKTFLGGLTPSGILTTARTFAIALAGILPTSGALLKSVGKVAAGSITPTGSVTKFVDDHYTGSVTPTGVVRKETQKRFTGSIASAGALFKTALKTFTGTLSSSGFFFGIAGSANPGTPSATALTGSSDNANANSYATASITPTGNRLVLAAVFTQLAAGPAAPTLSGNGLTWVQVATVVTSNRRLTVFRAMGASPSAGAVTIDFGGVTQEGCWWSIAEFSGVDTSGTNGSGAVVQSATNTATTTALTVTLAAFGSASNATYGAFGHSANEATAPGSGFTELHDVANTSPSDALQTEWRADNDTSVDASWSTSSTGFGVAVEIKGGAGGKTWKFDSTHATDYPHGSIIPTGALSAFKVGGILNLLSVAGAIVPGGALIKLISKNPTGSIASSGTLTKQTQKRPSGAVTPTGGLAKTVFKAFTGVITPTGFLSAGATQLYNLVVGGVITPAGALAKQVGKRLAGTITPAGSLTKLISKRFTGSITPTGALATVASLIQSGVKAIHTLIDRALTLFGLRHRQATEFTLTDVPTARFNLRDRAATEFSLSDAPVTDIQERDL